MSPHSRRPPQSELHHTMGNGTTQRDRAEGPAPENWPEREARQAEAAAQIRRLKSRASRGLVTIALFIGVSILAVVNFASLSSVPQHLRHILGAPPPAMVVSIALVVYSFSAILTTLSRITTGSGSAGGLAHIGYLVAFYLFYFFSASLAENFWGVFAAGLTILGLEAYQTWNWTMEEIRRIEEEGPQAGA